MYLTEEEKALSSEYLEKGFVIRTVADSDALNWMQKQFIKIISDSLGKPFKGPPIDILNFIHRDVPAEKLNAFRLSVIREINSLKNFRQMYFRVAKPFLETLVGNELSMQRRINLSIQLPNDDSSLLATHADTWSGDSPYEVVVWLPMVDCYSSKAMYLLPPLDYPELADNFVIQAGNSSEDLYQSIKNKVNWLAVKYGEVLIFDQSLPHGNRVNKESETRWSLNCRFKGVFTPYGDKKIGEFFEPITLRAASQKGMIYKLPKAS